MRVAAPFCAGHTRSKARVLLSGSGERKPSTACTNSAGARVDRRAGEEARESPPSDFKRASPGQHLVQHHAQSEEVGGLRRPPATQ